MSLKVRKTQPVCSHRHSFGKEQPILCSTETAITPCSVIKSEALDCSYSALRCSWLHVSLPSLPQQDAAVAKGWVSVGRWAGESPVPFFVYSDFEGCFHFPQAAEVTQLVATSEPLLEKLKAAHGWWESTLWSLHQVSVTFTLIWWKVRLGLSEWVESSSV